jgi:hypothetical protein
MRGLEGHRWRVEDTLAAFDEARKLCRAAGDADAKVVAAVVTLARSDRRLAATSEQWDRDKWLLGTPDGVIDLKTGRLRPSLPEDYITKVTTVAPGGDCPLWRQFLARVTGGDTELEKFLQRVCGYALTGDTSEDALFFFYGTGANGKSVFLRTIAGILGDHHTTASMEMFTVTNSERHPTDLADLRGARLVTAIETEEGKRWDEAKIKALTGGDRIKARFMRQDFFADCRQSPTEHSHDRRSHSAAHEPDSVHGDNPRKGSRSGARRQAQGGMAWHSRLDGRGLHELAAWGAAAAERGCDRHRGIPRSRGRPKGLHRRELRDRKGPFRFDQ